MSNNIFIDLTEELYNKGWTVNWEFNSDIDPALLKYNHCTMYTQCREVDANVYKDVDGNGAWNYRLDNLVTGGVYDMDSEILDGLFVIYNGASTPNTSLVSFNVDLPNLTNGAMMFGGCGYLTSFSSDLPKLTDSTMMFAGCQNLTSFSSDLPKLTNGSMMFLLCQNLTSFSSDLPKLTDGRNMFQFSGLTSFEGDLSSLTNGAHMFQISELTSFSSGLPSLTNGHRMFDGCELNTDSVKNIANTINDLSDDNDDGSEGWGVIYIDIANSTPSTEEETAFNTIASKGWTVYVNGSSWTSTASTSSTNLTEEEPSTSIPFYAKPIQVTEDEAEYVDANNNYYSIAGAQFIYGDDLSTYGMFTSFEHAESEIMLSLNLTKIEKTDLSN